jgi:hypothetical protein
MTMKDAQSPVVDKRSMEMPKTTPKIPYKTGSEKPVDCGMHLPQAVM